MRTPSNKEIADALEQEVHRLRLIQDQEANCQALFEAIKTAADPHCGGWGENADADERPYIEALARGDFEVIELSTENGPKWVHHGKDDLAYRRTLSLRIGEATFEKLTFEQVHSYEGSWEVKQWEPERNPYDAFAFAARHPALAELLAEGVFSVWRPDITIPQSVLGDTVSEEIREIVGLQLRAQATARIVPDVDEGPSP